VANRLHEAGGGEPAEAGGGKPAEAGEPAIKKK
jgi:hypothetical protein